MLVNVVPINIFKADLDLSTESNPEVTPRSAWSSGMLFESYPVRSRIILAKIHPPAGRSHPDGRHVSVVWEIQISIKIDTGPNRGCAVAVPRARRRSGPVKAVDVLETIRGTSHGFGTKRRFDRIGNIVGKTKSDWIVILHEVGIRGRDRPSRGERNCRWGNHGIQSALLRYSRMRRKVPPRNRWRKKVVVVVGGRRSPRKRWRRVSWNNRWMMITNKRRRRINSGFKVVRTTGGKA